MGASASSFRLSVQAGESLSAESQRAIITRDKELFKRTKDALGLVVASPTVTMIMPSQAGGVRTHRKRRRQYPGSVKAAALAKAKLEADDVEITIIFRVLGAARSKRSAGQMFERHLRNAG